MLDSVPVPSPEHNLICRCFVVTEATIREAVRKHNIHEVDDVTERTNACGGCGSCYPEIIEILDDIWDTAPAKPAAASASTMSDSEKRVAILGFLRESFAKILGFNSLEAHLVDVQGNRALIRFRGPAVGTQTPSFLAVKKHIVQAMSQLCGENMYLLELNVLEEHGTQIRTTS